MSNFYVDVIEKDPRFRSIDRIDDPNLLEPGTRAAVEAIMDDALAMGITLAPFETYRSAERQAMLYNHGATKLKNVGCHHWGVACDLVKKINVSWSWDGDYTFLANLAKKHKLISGSDWGQPNIVHDFIDSYHVQLIPLWRQPSLFNGSWYPPEQNYDPYADAKVNGGS